MDLAHIPYPSGDASLQKTSELQGLLISATNNGIIPEKNLALPNYTAPQHLAERVNTSSTIACPSNR